MDRYRGLRESGALCGEGTAAGRRCFAAGIFCGAANEREFLRAVILIGCRAAQAGRFVDTLCLFLYD